MCYVQLLYDMAVLQIGACVTWPPPPLQNPTHPCIRCIVWLLHSGNNAWHVQLGFAAVLVACGSLGGTRLQCTFVL
jgi:hypothetical protein